jgi:hypothetical protein
MSSSTSSSETDAWHRFTVMQICATSAVVAILYAFVAVVDPWNMLPLSPPLDRAPVTSNQRFAYPSLALSDRFDSAIIGTSGVRLLRPTLLNDLFDAHFVNLAMNAATPWEQGQIARLFLRAHPKPKRIILGVDYSWCARRDNIPKLTPRPFPNWMYDGSAWHGYLELLNLYAITEAGKEAGVLMRLKREDKGRDGYEVFVPPDDRYDPTRVAARLRAAKIVAPGEPGAGPPETWYYPAFDELLPIIRMVPRGTPFMLVFVPYNHFVIPPPGHPGEAIWSECKRRMARLSATFPGVQAIDFMRHSPITDDDSGYWDEGHVRVGVADRMARELASASRGEVSDDYIVLKPDAL